MRRLLALIVLFILPVVSAQTFPQNEDVLVSHPIRINGFPSASISANISANNPLGNFIVTSKVMTYNTTTLEHQYLIAGGNITYVGFYPYCITATGGGYNNTECFEFQVTPSGFDRLNSGEGMILFGSLVIIFSLSLVSLFIYTRSESTPVKVTFMTIAGLFFLITVLFSTILVQQNLAGFTNIISGYETFVFIVRQAVTLAVVAFFIFIFIFMLKAWKIRRGE